AMLRFELTDAREIVKRSFAKRSGSKEDNGFRRWLHDGFLANSARPIVRCDVSVGRITERISNWEPSKVSAEAIELSFHPDYKLNDGRYANNGWLQELPDPITKLSWDNAACVSPATAEALHINSGDVLKITVGSRTAEIPAWILPGQADFSISVAFGNGRRKTGRVGTGRGFNVNEIRSDLNPYFIDDVNVEKTGRRFSFACTQDESPMEDR